MTRECLRDDEHAAPMTSTRSARRRHALGCTILGLLSCTETTAPRGTPTVASVTIVAGDNQLVPELTPVPRQPSVVVKDSAGRPIAGARVLFAPDGPGRVDGAEQVTDADGIATVGGWTLDSSLFTSYILLATAGSVSRIFTARAFGAPMYLQIVVIYKSGDRVSSTSTVQVAAVGSPVAVAPAVKVTDAHFNPVPHAEVFFHVIQGDGSVGSTRAVSDTLGIARSGGWILGNVFGEQKLQASLVNAPPVPPVATFLATTAGAPAAIRVEAPAGGFVGAAGSALGREPRFSVTDVGGFDVPGALVSVTAVSGGGSVLDTTPRPIAAVGFVVPRRGITLGPSVGPNVFQATSGAAKIQFVVNAVSGPPASIAIEEGDAQRVVAGMPLRIRPTILVRDATGTPTPNALVRWTPASPSECGGFDFRPDSATDSNGRVTGCLFVLPPGTEPIRVQAGNVSTTIAATVLARPASVVVFDAPASLVLAADEAPPDMRISARVSLADGLPAAGYPVTLALVSPGQYPDAVEAFAVTDAAGVATAILRFNNPLTPGTKSVRATVTKGLEASRPLLVTAPITLTTISAGDAHSCGTSTDAAWFCWGNNASGQLGDGTTISRRAPGLVSFPSALFMSVLAAADHSCVHYMGDPYASRYPLYYLACVGRRRDGAIFTKPTIESAPSVGEGSFGVPGFDAAKLDVPNVFWRVDGSSHACVITQTGAMFCWGANGSGQLGDGTTVDRSAPVRVAGNILFTNPPAIGRAHTCAQSTTGESWCWGANESGQLGDGTNVGRLTPTRMATGLAFTRLSGGGAHSCGIAAGIVYCWGSNAEGQLGAGSRISSFVAIPVSGTRTYSALASGAAHTCALATTNGYAYCWGRNRDGQLGDGSTNDRLSPTLISPFAP